MQSVTEDRQGSDDETPMPASPSDITESPTAVIEPETVELSSMDHVVENSAPGVDSEYREVSSPRDDPDADDTTSGHHSFNTEDCHSDNNDDVEIDAATTGTDAVVVDQRSAHHATAVEQVDDGLEEIATGKIELEDDEDEAARQVRQNQMYARFQAWALRNYGETGKTKTVTRTKYDRVIAILSGREPPTADNSKLRFWIKAKGFRLGASGGNLGTDVTGCCGLLFIPAKNWGGSQNEQIDIVSIGRSSSTKFKRVAVVEDFFQIIYNVHVEMDGRGGKHAGQKRTYRAIAETYAFLPREAVTKFLMSCADCQKRMHLTMDNFGMVHAKGNSSLSKHARASHADGSRSVADRSNGSTFGAERRGLHHQPSGCSGKRTRNNNNQELMTITDYNMPITVSYLNYIKQRKRRKVRVSTNIPGSRKRSKLATTIESCDPNGRDWNYHQFEHISPSTRGPLNEDSSMNAFAEALSMASREGATFSECNVRRTSDGSIFDHMDLNDEDGHKGKNDEYNVQMKQDDDNVLPIDLSIATVTPPGEKNSCTSSYEWQLQGLRSAHAGDTSPVVRSRSRGEGGASSSSCHLGNEEDVSCGRSLSVGADDDDSRSVGLPDATASDKSVHMEYSRHSLEFSAKSEDVAGSDDTGFNGRKQSSNDSPTATAIRSSNGHSPSSAGQLLLLLASQDANHSSSSVYESSAFQAVSSVSSPRTHTGSSHSSPSKPVPFYHCSSPPPLVMFGSGMFPMSNILPPDLGTSSTLTPSMTTTTGSSSCANGQGQAAVIGHVPMPSIDFDLISFHDAIAFAAAAASATQVHTSTSLAVGMPPLVSQSSHLSTTYRHPAIVISSPPGEQEASVNDNPYMKPSSTSAEQCSRFQSVLGGGSISADEFRRYSRFQPPSPDGDQLALAALMAPISAAAAAAAASATAFSSGLITSLAQSSSIVMPPGGYRTMTSFSKERGKGQTMSADNVEQTPAFGRQHGSRSSPHHFPHLYTSSFSSTAIQSFGPSSIGPSTAATSSPMTSTSASSSSTRHQRQQQHHQRRTPFQADGLAAIRQIIAGYRDSAAFLCHSADELELLLAQQHRQRLTSRDPII